jgi:ABC-2 type transport system ATP-binding protein
MTADIVVSNLKKYYEIHKKEPGLSGSVKSLFNRRYEIVKAVDKISFKIDEGELVGFIGPNGAGKTTTLKCLSGLLYPTDGYVSVLGFTPWDRKNEFLKQISLVMGQKNQLWWDLPALETFNLNREIYEIPKKQYEETLGELVQILEVEDILKVQVRKLSLGQRMKCELIAALLHSPKVLFLDEPTIGLDVVSQKKMRDFIREYNYRKKATIILTSHYMDDVKELCRRVIIIDKGKLIFDGQLSEITHKYADHKIISAILAKEIDAKKLEKVGTVKEYAFPKVVFSVKREAASLAAAELLQHFPVADLNIEEVPIEEIIREVFTGKDLA